MIKKLVYRFVYIGLLIGLCYGTILRLPCKTFADFKVYLIDKRLIGNVLMSFNGLQDTQCMVKCIENAKCRSYNTNKEDGRCEINGKALVDNGTMLATDINWVYKSTNYSSTLIGPVCNSLKPCDDKILCKDTCDPPYYKCVYCDGDHGGLDCSTAIDLNECSSNPCKNSGTCVDEFASYKCTCLNGYTGKNCEIDIDECSSLPCFNGGVCTNEIGNYTCNCTNAIGYHGRNCEKEIDECVYLPCLNGGVCRSQYGGKYTCTCVKGYIGEHCETVELNITIKSYGSEDPGYGQQPIQINGNNIGTSSRGFNVVVMSHINGQKLGADNFDTYGNSAADDAMVNFIESFPNGSIIVMAATDSAEAKLSQDTRDYISSLGSISINSIQFRSSFALLTSKGTSKPDWFAEKYAAVKNGPSVIEANMRFPSL